MPRVADRILGEVVRDDPQHPRTQRQLERLVALEPELDAGSCGALCEVVEHLGEDRERERLAERDDLAARLELAQEQDLVDQLACLLDLGTRLLDQLFDVGVGQSGGVEEREDAGQGRSQLVRDGRREARPQRLVRVGREHLERLDELGLRTRLDRGHGLGFELHRLRPAAEEPLHQFVTTRSHSLDPRTAPQPRLW